MMNALGALLIMFVVMVVVSFLGILFLFLSNNKKIQNGVFFFLACWGMLLSWMNATSGPSNYISRQLLAWAIGFIAVIAMLIRYAGHSENRFPYSNILVSLSVVLSVLTMFFV